ncbi:MAG: nucleoside hydrolase [Planctomycetes bacterium]|nr:nucleoside hydrolase [Planctomycetota bacterium]
MSLRAVSLAVLALVLATPVNAAPPKAIPVVIDTDIGADIDDAFALALAVASPELEIVGITTVGRGGPPDPYVQHISKERDEDRAWLVCRFLTQVGRKDVPVAPGADPQPKSEIDWQIQYRRHPAAIFNRTLKPTKESAVELLTKLAKEKDGELVVIAIGPLTNIASFIKEQPEAAKRVKRFVLMGGSVAVGYDGKPKPEAEWNIKTDIAAAKAVFTSGLPLTVVPLDATATLKLEKKQREAIFAANSMLTWQVQNLYELWGQETPILFDPAAVMATFDDKHFTWNSLRLEVSDNGMTLVKDGKVNARVATAVKAEEFTAAVVERLRAHGKPALPQPPKNASKLIEPGMFPLRVHAFEDYDTDHDKRWWMCGKLETADTPTKGGRAQRAVLTQDFDDRQGDMKTMYRAVIFNPVPGPPMSEKTRLRFRYKLTGTDTIRVQLYSLTNGYHRYLSVSGLQQGQWLDGCVDMTAMRRPDGTGGPLAKDERIDDIQFYVDPRAELLIDDIVLYDAAAADEKRPFPKRVLYTGLFDTGKQGKEWPGQFEIVNHEKPLTWKAAKSVLDKDGKPTLVLGLRGARKLDEQTELTFRYKFTGQGEIAVTLLNAKGDAADVRSSFKPKVGEWAEVTLKFTPAKGTSIEAISFGLPEKSELLLDDVLLYTPG